MLVCTLYETGNNPFDTLQQEIRLVKISVRQVPVSWTAFWRRSRLFAGGPLHFRDAYGKIFARLPTTATPWQLFAVFKVLASCKSVAGPLNLLASNVKHSKTVARKSWYSFDLHRGTSSLGRSSSMSFHEFHLFQYSWEWTRGILDACIWKWTWTQVSQRD